ncbi:sugar transferase [Eggerthella timonensis]|uniref:sugar transferase n=1 Tax=Eggerthella timonensis TaxID=1871008 RepID=UPI001C60A38B|nr:sugar transferase [Eggerthella timonensis]
MTEGFAMGDGMADGTLAIGDDGFAEAVMESDNVLSEKAHGGNDAWIRGEVAEASAVLAARNLAHANAVSGPVHPRRTLYLRFGKRVLDVVLSGAALLLTLPVNAVLAVLTYRDVGSPIFYVQERTGRDLKSFKMVKFRNMTEDRDEDGELLPPEDRITRLGLFVRSHSLDELLNFWSVFKGDMSLIGPRPLPVEFTPHMTERHKMRYAVRPGLECPRVGDEEPEAGADYSHVRFENDVRYVESVSFLTDVRLAFRLVGVVLGRGGSGDSTGTDSHFAGYDSEGCAMSLGRLKDPACYRREILGIDDEAGAAE